MIKITDLYEDFEYLLTHNKVRDIYYNIKYGIKNLYYYLPVVWKNREWDYSYIYIILNKKFERMEHLHRNYGHLIRSNRTAKQLMIAKNLTKRLIEYDYISNALIDYNKKYKDDFKLKFESIEGKKYSRLINNRPESQKKSLSRSYKHSEEMEKQDFDMLIELIHNNMRSWWD